MCKFASSSKSTGAAVRHSTCTQNMLVFLIKEFPYRSWVDDVENDKKYFNKQEKCGSDQKALEK
jgi:hypothetical protein